MKNLRIALLGLAAFSAVSIAPVEALAMPGRGSNTVTVWGDRGGYVIDYAIKMLKVKKRGDSVKFAGSCDSACTIYLALPRSKTCVTPGASFGFHLPYGSSGEGNATAAAYMMRSYPGWVRSWIGAKGGLTHSLKTMDYAYISQHMPSCAPARSEAAVYAFNSKSAFAAKSAFKGRTMFSLALAFEGR